MKEKASKKPGLNNVMSLLQPLMALGLLFVLAFYLYSPHFFQLGGLKILFPVSSILASMGCYTVSRRWITSFDASLLAGALYGFGPFGLSFFNYHPVAGLIFSLIPWLLCPAVFYHGKKHAGPLAAVVSCLLTMIPFICIVFVFWILSKQWAGPLLLMPKSRMLEFDDLKGLITPLAFTVHKFAIGDFHACLLMAVMGLCVFAVSGKESLLTPVLAGVILSLLPPVFEVSPIIWLSFAALFIAVLSGLGIQSLAWAGKSDRPWILLCLLIGLALAGTNYVLYFIQKTHSSIYQEASWLFLAASGAIACIYVLTSMNIRLRALRWLVLFGICVFDITIIAHRLVDSLF